MSIKRVLEHEKAPIWISIVAIIVAVTIPLFSVVFWFQEVNMSGHINTIEENRRNIAEHQKEISGIKNLVTIFRGELESEIKRYIDGNYREFSKRDEKVDKLAVYFRQQEARLANIESALSKL